MKPSQLSAFARHALGDLCRKSGQVMYSGAETLAPAPLYLLGFNPGGKGSNKHLMKIGRSLESLAQNHTNSYLDTIWHGDDRLQRRVVWLLAGLGFHPRKVPASNLVFVRSFNAAGINFLELANRCWPVHEKILEIVRPKVVLCYGNSSRSPYSYLRRKLEVREEARGPRSGHGDWMCRTFVGPDFRVIGLPHLSRYDITGHPEVVRWIKRFLRGSPNP